MDTIIEILTNKIDLPANNMREYIDRDELHDLAADIKVNGLISPITVRPKNERYELVAGQRRYLACQIAGIIEVRCIVRELSDEEALAIMTSENLARVDVNIIDEAKHVGRLLEQYKGDVKAVASLVRRSPGWVIDRCTVFEMPDYMQELLAKKELKLGVALVLAQIDNDNMRRMWTLQAASEGVSVATAEYWYADYKRRSLPGGDLSNTDGVEANYTPPAVVKFRCAIDGNEYDTRTIKSIMIYEGNFQYFNAFVEAFRADPSEI